MKRSYSGQRGRIAPSESEPQHKKRITIRIDADLIDWFTFEAMRTGGRRGYQTLVNAALRQFVEGRSPEMEALIRRDLIAGLKPDAE
jgi:uncharacterized protein (DUF4415 family)